MDSIRAQRIRYRLMAGLVVMVVLVAWWWPGLTGQDGQLDVVLIPSAETTPYRDVIDRRLREEGFTTAWEATPEIPCTPPAPRHSSFERLVVFLPDRTLCSDPEARLDLSKVLEGIGGRDVIGVIPWDLPADVSGLMNTLADASIRIVDPRDLIGVAGEVQDCLWWDDCPPEGRIATIDGDRLTDAGSQRLARRLVAGLL